MGRCSIWLWLWKSGSSCIQSRYRLECPFEKCYLHRTSSQNHFRRYTCCLRKSGRSLGGEITEMKWILLKLRMKKRSKFQLSRIRRYQTVGAFIQWACDTSANQANCQPAKTCQAGWLRQVAVHSKEYRQGENKIQENVSQYMGVVLEDIVPPASISVPTPHGQALSSPCREIGSTFARRTSKHFGS